MKRVLEVRSLLYQNNNRDNCSNPVWGYARSKVSDHPVITEENPLTYWVHETIRFLLIKLEAMPSPRQAVAKASLAFELPLKRNSDIPWKFRIKSESRYLLMPPEPDDLFL